MARQFLWAGLLSDEENSVLEKLYINHAVAIDQLRRRPLILAQIARAFRAITGRDDLNSSTLLGYMMNRRKCRKWVKLGKRAQRMEPWGDILSDADFAALMSIYLSLDETSDSYLLQPALLKAVSKSFLKLTNREVDGSILTAAMIAKRKRGVWPAIRRGNWGFGDIHQVG